MIWDAFIYNGEEMMLELHLETMWDTVDKFFIIEANKTFKGRPKPAYFMDNKKQFDKYKDKIVAECIQLPETKPEQAREVESAHREALWALIQQNVTPMPTDTILLLDVDEIPNPEAIKEFVASSFTLADLVMIPFKFKFNLKVGEKWVLPKIGRADTMLKIHPNILRQNYPVAYEQKNGGWHFSSVMSPPEMVRKYVSVADENFHPDRPVSLEFIYECIEQQKPINWNNPKEYFTPEVIAPKFLPQEIQNNIIKYAPFIIQRDNSSVN